VGCQHDAVGVPELAEDLEAEQPVGGHLGRGITCTHVHVYKRTASGPLPTAQLSYVHNQVWLTTESLRELTGCRYQRRRFARGFFLGMPGVNAWVISLTFSSVAVVMALCMWRRACAVVWPRALEASWLAELSHMLMYGFFFSHGLRMQGILLSLYSLARMP